MILFKIIALLAVTGVWMRGPDPGFVQVFRRDVECLAATNLKIDVSADIRYVLTVDGKIVGRGPDRDTLERWSYRTYRLPLAAGCHRLESVVYHGGPEGYKPLAQISHAQGFFCGGLEGWRVASVPKSVFSYGGRTGGAFGAGLPNLVRGNSPEFLDFPEAAFKVPVEIRRELPTNKYAHRFPGWRLVETRLPQQDERLIALPATPFPKTIPAYSEETFDVSFDGYLTAYPFLTVKGGTDGEIRCAWAESGQKADSGVVFEDSYRPTGGTGRFTTSWLRCGTRIRFFVKTADEPLTLESLQIVESRYPLTGVGRFSCDRESLVSVWRMCRRGLELCAHEGVWDCPFFEQLTYLGDTRVQFLAQNVLTADDCLQKHVMELFADACTAAGLMPMNTPCDGPQSESATYTLVYPIELADYMRWHVDKRWLERQLPTLLSVMTGVSRYENSEGLIEGIPGWCFVDWADWANDNSHPGCGPEAGKVSAIENLFYLLALQSTEEVCRSVGETAIAEAWRERRKRLSISIKSRFWDSNRNLLADNLCRTRFSEHAQALALLTDVLTEPERLACIRSLSEDSGLIRASVYFSHYLFEAFGRAGRTDLILERLGLWRSFVQAGLWTPPETALPARSDCHGWSGHPVYHLARHFAGISPDGEFFSRVRIAPQPASLRDIRCTVAHVHGPIDIELSFADGNVKGFVRLPPSLEGTFVWRDFSQPLVAGDNEVSVLGLADVRPDTPSKKSTEPNE